MPSQVNIIADIDTKPINGMNTEQTNKSEAVKEDEDEEERKKESIS